MRLERIVNPKVAILNLVESFINSLFLTLFLVFVKAEPMFILTVFVISFLSLFFRRYRFLSYAYKKVILDEYGIKCNGVTIKWENVSHIEEFIAYDEYLQFFGKIKNRHMTERFDIVSGKMICFNATETDFYNRNFDNRIYIHLDKQVNEFLKKHCIKYTENKKNSEKHNHNYVYVVNLRVIASLLLLNIVYSVPFLIFFSGFFYPNLWKSIVMVTLYIFSLLLIEIRMCNDAFSIIRVDNNGLHCCYKSILWKDIKNLNIERATVKLGIIKFKCGHILSVNSKYSDSYLHRHSAECIYVYPSKKVMETIKKHCEIDIYMNI